jgi:hypothetical protein
MATTPKPQHATTSRRHQPGASAVDSRTADLPTPEPAATTAMPPMASAAMASPAKQVATATSSLGRSCVS